MKLLLGGVNGAGKTTLLQKIKEARPEFEVIKGSSAFMEYLGIPGDYEALRAIPEPVALEKLEQMLYILTSKHKDLIFDSHYLNIVRGKIKAVTSPYLKKFDVLLLLKVSADTVIARTSVDTRDRALFPEGISEEEKAQMLKDYIEKYEEEFNLLCKKYEIPGKILNGENTPDEILKEFLEYIDTQK